jgi:glycosyltransferase involved in cell wall biosynthesis
MRSWTAVSAVSCHPVLLDLRRLQQQSIDLDPGVLCQFLGTAPAWAVAAETMALLVGDGPWAGTASAPVLLSWLRGRNRRLCLDSAFSEAVVPLLLAELGEGAKLGRPCQASGVWELLEPSSVPVLSAPPAEQPAERERLALFSPLPPVPSGITAYSQVLLPWLADHFRIDAVADPDATPLPQGAEAVITSATFERRRQDYQHRLYQVGNSILHLEHLRQLRQDSGAIVLHDFYLSHGLCHPDADAVLGGDTMQRLYRSHGFQAAYLHHCDRLEHTDRAIWRYPCNLEPLQAAAGVIVHSQEAIHLAQAYYGADAAADWSVVPHLKTPCLPTPQDRAAARTALGLEADAFVVCSFGFLGVAKLSDRLLEGFLQSSLALDPRVVLVFAGSDAGNFQLRQQLGRAVRAAGRRGGLQARVLFTGWITPADYQQYLAAADAAVQLRSASRGETSGTVLDCLGAGIPLIVNAHGSMRELPEEAVLRLADDCSPALIAEALQRLRSDPALRQRLSRAALAMVTENHGPTHCAGLYAGALRAASARLGQRQRWLQAAAGVVESGGDPVQVSNSLALLHPPRPRQRQLFLDVTVVARDDLGSGVQRVVRALSEQLLLHPPEGFRVELVSAAQEGLGYRYARPFALHLLNIPPQPWEEAPIEYRAGDVFLGIDLHPDGVVRQRAFFQLMRAQGVAVHFVVHDLLPCLQPHNFPPGADVGHEAWLQAISSCDGALCVSRSVAADLRQWLQVNPPAAGIEAFQVGWFHHGSDFLGGDPDRPAAALTDDESRQLAALPQGPTLLMVGTIEPRKGYLDVIEAASLLWRQGAVFNLVIVGKEGWVDLPASRRRTIPQTMARLRQHPLRNQRLFWFGSASDALLQGLYARADGLIAASYGEGFGIPLIEAGRAGLPLLVRELPVFREVTQGRASFFPNDADVNHLAAAIAAFLSRLDGRNPPFVDTALPCQSWQQSAVQVVAMLGMVAQAGGLQPAAALPTSTRSQENGRPHPLLRSARRFKRLLRRVRHRFQGRRAGALGIASLPTASPPGLLEGAQPWLQALERQRASKSPKAR